jgi:hypothetical protein
MIDEFFVIPFLAVVAILYIAVLISLRDAMESKKEEGKHLLGILWALRITYPFRAWLLMVLLGLMTFAAFCATILRFIYK